MSYQVYARKYRPQCFDEVLGQEAVNQTLKNAIQLSRLHQAYLFCGARGVGKTSLARIFAKSLNCEKGPTVTPCQTCASCKGITTGNAMDVLEIDGASNTGVDDVRELREQVKYLPLSGKYKIYIIDEVHMLSTSAFNALLKTLEEPPPHVLFIFATTEPHKIPITILSRCQKFDFRRMNLDQLVGHLKGILSKEEVNFSDDILYLIAKCADGSVRDSLSLLDQVVSFCGQKADPDAVREILGLADRAVLMQMLQTMVAGQQADLLTLSGQAYEKGTDLKILAEGLLELLYQLILLQNGGVASDAAPGERDELKALAAKADASKVLTQFQMLNRGVEEIARSEFPRMIFDVTLIKLMKAGDLLSVADMKKLLSGTPLNSAPVQKAAPATVSNSFSKPTPVISQVSTQAQPQIVRELSIAGWKNFIEHTLKADPMLGSFLEHGVPSVTGDKVVLSYDSKSSLQADMIKERLPKLQQAATAYFGKTLAITIQSGVFLQGQIKPLEEREQKEKSRVEAVRVQAMANPAVLKAQEILGAKVKEVKEIK